MRGTLRHKFTTIYVALALCILTVGAVSTGAMYWVGKNVDGMIEEDYKNIQAADEMLELIDRQDSAALTYMSFDRVGGIEVFTEGMQNYLKWQYQLEAGAQSAEMKREVEKLTARYDHYCKAFSLLQEQPDQQQMYSYYQQSLAPDLEEIKAGLRRARQTASTQMLSRKNAATRQAVGLSAGILGFSALLTALGLWLSLRGTRRYLAPLGQLCQGLRDVSAGGELREVSLAAPGEIGQLEREFNKMIGQLRAFDEQGVNELLAEKKKTDAILQNMEDAFFLLDGRLLIQTMNPAACRLFSTAESVASGRHILEVLDSEQVVSMAESVLGGEQRSECQLQLPGDERVFNAVCTRMPHVSADSPWCLSLLLQNITVVKKTEKIRGDFIATVSHELKTPLTSMLMGASMLQNGDMGPLGQQQAEVVSALREDIDRMGRLIEDLLELSKVQSGNVSYRMAATNIRQIARQTTAQFADLARYSQVSLAVDMPALPPVYCDGEKLGWVFSNILGNALKYTRPGDDIRLSAADTGGGWVEVSVADTGMGVPPEYLHKIFESDFTYQENDLETRGSGIGLFLSQKIVRAHGGDIWVRPGATGGSIFSFTVPIYDKTTRPEEDSDL